MDRPVAAPALSPVAGSVVELRWVARDQGYDGLS